MSKTANQWLSRFRVDITSNSNRIYANGRQQVEVTVTVEPRQGEHITEAQLDTLTLLEIDEQGGYRLLDNKLVARTRRNTRFEYHAATGNAPQHLLESNSHTQRRTFYVSSKHPGGTLSRVYAGIYMDETTHFESDVAPFKSSVVIESITPHRFAAQHFELSRHDVANEGDWDIDVYYLKFKNPNDRIVQTISYGVPSGQVFDTHSINNTTWYNWEATGYQHNSVAYGLGPEKDHYFGGDHSVRVNDKPGMMTLVRTRLSIPGKYQPIGGGNDAWSGDCIWGIVDQHGNEHTVKFYTRADGNLIDFMMYP